MKKIFKIAITVFFALTMALTVFANTAINCSDWARGSMELAVEKGFVPEDLLSKANQLISRKDLCRLVIKYYEAYTGADVKATGKTPFTDVDNKDVTAAVELGLFSGVGPKVFNPSGQVTKEQMATAMNRVFEKVGIPLLEPTGKEEKFSDDAEISQWAKTSVAKLKKNGIISGTGKEFNPKDATTLEQAVVVLMQTQASSVYKSSGGAEAVIVGNTAVSLGESSAKLIIKLGEPDRIDKNQFGLDRYVYNDDYSKFIMVSIKDDKIVEIYTNAKDFSYGKISASTTFDSMKFDDFKSYSSEKAFYENGDYNLTVYFDSVGNKGVDAVRLLKAGMITAKDFYSASYESSVEMEIVDIVNSARVKNGLSPYNKNSFSDVVAKTHSKEMEGLLKSGYNSASGLTPFQRMEAAGIKYTIAAENICTTVSGDSIEIYGWWMKNLATRSNLMSEKFTNIGVGCVASARQKTFFTTADMYTKN